jgi:hypothetical protein
VWLVGSLLLAVLIWWMVEATTPEARLTTIRRAPDVVIAPREQVAGARQQTPDVVQTGAVRLSDVVMAPTRYLGREVSGDAIVERVVSDRGFWIIEGGRRLFALLHHAIPESPPDIDAGQRIRLRGVFTDPAIVDSVVSGPLAADARQSLQGQPGFILVTSVEVLETAAASTPAVPPGPTGVRPPVETPPAGTRGPAEAPVPGEAPRPTRTPRPAASPRAAETPRPTEPPAVTITPGISAIPEAPAPGGIVETPLPAETPPVTSDGTLPVTRMLANPEDSIGRTVAGTATVAEVVSDDGFWVEQGARRLFVARSESLAELPEIRRGQRVRIRGLARDPRYVQRVLTLSDLPESVRRRLLRDQVYLLAWEVEPFDR